MVEGHQVHRLRHSFNQVLAGKCFKATSPNGRFKDGAKAISGKKLEKLEAVGKNLFAFFEGNHVIHVHFGMSGQWRVFDKALAPEPTATTRLKLENDDLVTHLSAMTLNYGDLDLFLTKKRSLGQDPLREDADPEALWEKVQRCKKSIGLVLMDQTMFPGVGNIYRAEILFKAGIHPNRIANNMSREEFDKIWGHSVDLLQRGFTQGSIITVDKEESIQLGKPNMRRYIYNQSRCGRCGNVVLSWDMASRTCYACPTCQPASGVAIENAVPVKPFRSRCAADALADRLKTPEKLTVKELRHQLKTLGMDSVGNKSTLLERYRKHLESGLKLEDKTEDQPTVVPKAGTSHLKKVRSAKEAAKEKSLAGEKRNVEHVAEVDFRRRSTRLKKERK